MKNEYLITVSTGKRTALIFKELKKEYPETHVFRSNREMILNVARCNFKIWPELQRNQRSFIKRYERIGRLD